MEEVGNDVTIEPQLQPLTTESLHYRSSNRANDARLDIKAKGFWDCRHQNAYFDVRVFNPLATSYRDKPLPTVYRQQEQETKRTYEDRVIQVEHGCFPPLFLLLLVA